MKKQTLEEVERNMRIEKFKILQLAEEQDVGFINLPAITWKDIVNYSHNKQEHLLKDYVRSISELSEIEKHKRLYNEYKDKVIEMTADMLATKPIEYSIVVLRDKLKWEWNSISKITNYSLRQARNIYDKGKKQYK